MAKILNFGCRLNISEGESIRNLFTEGEEKNMVIINSCAVTQEAEKTVIQSIRRARKENKNAKIVLTGCAAQISPQKYEEMEEVNLVLGNLNKFAKENYTQSDVSIVSNIMDNDVRNSEYNLQNKTQKAMQIVTNFENYTRAFVEIQNGCDHRCTFCIIPYGRGNSRSVPLGRIHEQIEKLVEAGYSEIVLTGVDITSYGNDLPIDITLGGMIRRILKLIPNLPRLRLSSIDVAEIDDDIFYLLENEPRFMPYFHLSLQSGDDMILKRMKRRHTRGDVIKFCNHIRNIRGSNISIGADIIAGFPTETEKMFENTYHLVEDMEIHFLHIFPYSAKDGTPAAKMPQLLNKVKKSRAKVLRELGNRNLHQLLSRMIGTRQNILFENSSSENYVGRCENFVKACISKNIMENDISNQIISLHSSQMNNKENFLEMNLI